MHVAHAGSSRMLTNAAPLTGIAPRITSLAARERQVSAMTLDMLKSGTAPPPPPPLSAHASNAAGLAAATPATTPGSALTHGGSGGAGYFGSPNGITTDDSNGDDATPVALEAGGAGASPGYMYNPVLGPAFSAEAPMELPVVERVPGTAPVPEESPPSRPLSARAAGLARPSSGRPGSARRSSLFRRSPATPELKPSAASAPSAAAAVDERRAAAEGPAALHGRHVSFDGVENTPPASPPPLRYQ